MVPLQGVPRGLLRLIFLCPSELLLVLRISETELETRGAGRPCMSSMKTDTRVQCRVDSGSQWAIEVRAAGL